MKGIKMKDYKINLNDVILRENDIVNVTVKSTNEGQFIDVIYLNLKYLGTQQLIDYTSPFFVFVEQGEKPKIRLINPHDIREISFELSILEKTIKTVEV